MEGTLVVNEERNVIEKFQGWYKEKMIDTGFSQKAEKYFVKTIDYSSQATEAMAGIGAVVVGFIPEVQFLAPLLPGIAKVRTKLYDFGKNATIKAKRVFEAGFIGADGSNEEVVIPDFDLDKTIDDVKDGAATIKGFIDEVGKEGKCL